MNQRSSATPHIIFIITKLELGGAQKICLALVKEMQGSGFLTTLVTGPGGRLMSEAEKLGPVHVISDFMRELSLFGVIKEIKAFYQLYAFLRLQQKECPNLIIHTHSSKAGLVGRWAAWFAGCKNIVHTVHGYAFHDRQRFIVRFAFQALEWVTCLITSRIVCVSKKDKQVGERLFSGFKRKSVIIRASVETSFFEQKEDTFYPARVPNLIRIGSIGCFKPQKNLIDLLKAFSIVLNDVPASTKKNIRLEIIGDGIMKNELESCAKQLNILKNVVFLGWKTNVLFYMKQWDIFAMSSLWEGLPCAIVEAKLNNLPVVAYDVGGISEVITHRVSGFLVEPGDVAGLAQHLVTLVCDQRRRMFYGQYDGKKISEFTYAAMAAGHRKLYKNILK